MISGMETEGTVEGGGGLHVAGSRSALAHGQMMAKGTESDRGMVLALECRSRNLKFELLENRSESAPN